MAAKKSTATKKNETANEESPKLELDDSQQRVAEALVFSGVSYERERLTKIFEPHRDKAVNVDVVIDIINNIPPKADENSTDQE